MATHVQPGNASPTSNASSPVGTPVPSADVNALQPVQRRVRAKESGATVDSPAARPVPPENSMGPSKRLLKEKRSARVEVSAEAWAKESRPAERQKSPTAASPPRPAPASRLIPDEIRERFVQVGNTYYFADGARAFTDRGRRLTTPSENTEVIKSLVTIAQARGWSEIAIRGTERFRKEAWFAARLAGLDVRGYKPSEFEQSHVIRALARAQGMSATKPEPEGASPDRAPGPRTAPEREKSSGPVATKRARGGLLTGKLVDHGRAAYHHDPREGMSYFIKMETPRGERVIWGVDLERAFKESLTRPQIGDEVGLRAVRQDAVKVKTPERDAEGKVIGEKDLETHRNRWIVEKRGFFESRAEAARTLRDPTVDPKQAVKRHPELVGTYLQVHAAELAARQFRDPQDQQRFVAQVRSALADAVAHGEPLQPVRLRERTAERPEGRSPSTREREQAPVRG